MFHPRTATQTCLQAASAHLAYQWPTSPLVRAISLCGNLRIFIFGASLIHLAILQFTWATTYHPSFEHLKLSKSNYVENEQAVQATCTGVMNITAITAEIQDLSKHSFRQQLGSIAYSLDSSGNLSLNSLTSSWKCTTFTNFVSSNYTSSTDHKKGEGSEKDAKKKTHDKPVPTQSVGAQLHCRGEQEILDVTWVTPWTTIIFYGSLFFQIEMVGENCNKPAELVLDYSRCSFNTTTATKRDAVAIPCQWESASVVQAIPK
ncbi:hypothetical protein O181_060403 [Austropuccinia psidii MF-1]|uniref:Uncharacterized protein n=1 Tax=Austropuccinia psidii MF-1 TaxID=1389203 RepID=A0A9Q3HXI3_9BASI|nr:hypothetical protein [Austropuccinia psidii MF-1]